MSRLRRKEAIEGYVAISPWIIGGLVFTAGPILYSLVLSFSDWDLIGRERSFIGFENYRRMVRDPLFWHSLWVTVKFTLVSVPVRMALALGLALVLVSKLPGMRFFRTMFYLPAVMGGVVVALLWMWVFQPNFGILNYLLTLVGIEGPRWLGDPAWALWSIVVMSVWSGLPITVVLFVAGLVAVPPDLYEAAEVDGAGSWSRFRWITLPMLSPTILFVLVTSMITSFQVFDAVFIATQGGPLRSTLMYLLYFYQQGFSRFDMGYASALVQVLMLIVLGLTLLIFRWSSFWVYYESEER